MSTLGTGTLGSGTLGWALSAIQFLAGNLKLYSYLPAGTTVTATSTTLIESGLAVVLSANTTYHINSVTYNTANGDGIKLKYAYSGTVVDGAMLFTNYATGTAEATAINATLADTGVDGVIKVEGIVRTGSAGKLSLQFAKYTDTTDDTPLQPGSFIVATPI